MKLTSDNLDILVLADDLKEKGLDVEIALSDMVRDELAKNLELSEISVISAGLTVRPTMGRRFALDGTVSAEIVQSCVITGDPVHTKLQFSVSREYAEDVDPLAGLSEAEEAEYADEESDIDPLTDGHIDIGNAIYEELALQIPPYPRVEGANFAGYSTDAAESASSENPFAALADLKNKLKSKG